MRCERCGQREADVRPNWNKTHKRANHTIKLMIADAASRVQQPLQTNQTGAVKCVNDFGSYKEMRFGRRQY